MVVLAVMLTLCAVGAAFYLRFLVALCRKSTCLRVCYLVRLQSDPDECTGYLIVDTDGLEPLPIRRAA
jgi:hypothetical protein